MILETERLILRPFDISDAQDIYDYAKDPDVGLPAGWPPHMDVSQSLEIIKNLNNPECYAICKKEDNIAIGSIELKLNGHTDMTEKNDECEMGFCLGKRFWGQGIVPEAARELLRHAFKDLGMNAVWAGYYDGNEKSKRAQEKIGFSYHHTAYNIPVTRLGEVRTGHSNIITKQDWLCSFEFRKLTEDEIPSALSLSWRVFSEFESPVYSEEGTDEFRKCLNDSSYLSGIEYFGAFDRKILTGILGIRKETCHICFFFVDEKYQRLGIGRRLFNKMMSEYKGKNITLNSSPYGLDFYHALGFVPTDTEKTVNGIRFTPMSLNCIANDEKIVKLSEYRFLKDRAALWFSEKWSVPLEAYQESIEQSFSSVVPSWYLYMKNERIVAGLGVIENDFHNRADLTPNVCAVFTEPEFRNKGIAGKLLRYVCENMSSHGIETLYLLTDHVGFYERYGWKFFCYAQGNGEEKPSRMYIHQNTEKNDEPV